MNFQRLLEKALPEVLILEKRRLLLWKFIVNDRLCVNYLISTKKKLDINQQIPLVSGATQKRGTQPSANCCTLHRDNTEAECKYCPAYSFELRITELRWSALRKAARRWGKSCKTGAAEKFLKPEKTTNTQTEPASPRVQEEPAHRHRDCSQLHAFVWICEQPFGRPVTAKAKTKS